MLHPLIWHGKGAYSTHTGYFIKTVDRTQNGNRRRFILMGRNSDRLIDFTGVALPAGSPLLPTRPLRASSFSTSPISYHPCTSSQVISSPNFHSFHFQPGETSNRLQVSILSPSVMTRGNCCPSRSSHFLNFAHLCSRVPALMWKSSLLG
jgi:hypothetical protein